MRKTVLVVDDSVFILEELKFMLKDSEFEIVGFSKRGEDALNLYEQLQPDLVTMDIILPGMDGIEASRILLHKWPEAKIVIVSSLAYEDTVAEAHDAGIIGFLFKPFEEEALLDSLRNALDTPGLK